MKTLDSKLTQQVAPSAHVGARASRDGLAVAAVQVPERQVAAGMRVAGGSVSRQRPLLEGCTGLAELPCR